MNKASTFKNFFGIINKLKKVEQFNKKIKNKKQRIHCYAHQLGNVLLQYFRIDHKKIDFVAERNKNKYGLFTPGSKIKIISEKTSRKLKPNYYLVLPWHFKNEILKREKKSIKKGIKFIFPLPKLKII